MIVVDYGPDVAALRRRLEAAEAEVARLRVAVDAADDLAAKAALIPRPFLCAARREIVRRVCGAERALGAYHDARVIAAEEARRG